MTSGPSDIATRRFAHEDIAAALRIQESTYPAFLLEERDAFASRLDISGSYCLAAVRDGELVAYLLAHGWAKGAPPPVGAILDGSVPSEILFIHDLAVSLAGQGQGLGQRLVHQAFDMAWRDGLRSAELIAVEGAAGYWSRLGFTETATSPELAAKVAAYGADARWMTRKIPAGPS